jgi:cytidyltransferase-related domain
MPTYDYLVFIGRFQPFTNAHLDIIKTALQSAKHVIVLVGSANSARCPRNPFTFAERQQMISKSIMRDSFAPTAERLHILPLADCPYNDEKWKAGVQRAAASVIARTNENPNHYANVGLIGHNKDASSFYLKMFPQWGSVNVESKHNGLNATSIRKAYFREYVWVDGIAIDVPAPTAGFMKEFLGTKEWINLYGWYEHDRNYKWKNEPINCSDVVAIQSGHILLVTRGNVNGKGQLALPGGHKEKNETFRQCAIRELKEETFISDGRGEIPKGVLAGYIGDRSRPELPESRMFDDPYRSSRGCVTTMAFLFRFPDNKELFKVIGADDAEYAQWVPLGDLKPEMFFEDHYHIIDTMLGGL